MTAAFDKQADARGAETSANAKFGETTRRPEGPGELGASLPTPEVPNDMAVEKPEISCDVRMTMRDLRPPPRRVKALTAENAILTRELAEAYRQRSNFRVLKNLAEEELELALVEVEKLRSQAKARLKTNAGSGDTAIAVLERAHNEALEQVEKLNREVARLKSEPSDLSAGDAVAINALLIAWPQAGEKASKKALCELRDRIEKRSGKRAE